MNQTFSWSAFLTGLTTFISIASEIVTVHTKWTDFATPYGVIHLLVLGASFAAMIAGAIGIQVPRQGSHSDRSGDPPPLSASPPGSETIQTTTTKVVKPLK